jgi:hypothetical protein
MKYFIHLIVLIYLKQISNEQFFESQTQVINGKFFLKDEQINSVQVVENVNFCLKGVYVYFSHKNKIKTGVLIQDRKNGDIVIHENNWNLIDCYQESTEVINTDDFVITQRSHFNEISFKSIQSELENQLKNKPCNSKELKKATETSTQPFTSAMPIQSDETWLQFFYHFIDDKNDYCYIGLIILIFKSFAIFIFRDKIKCFNSRRRSFKPSNNSNNYNSNNYSSTIIDINDQDQEQVNHHHQNIDPSAPSLPQALLNYPALPQSPFNSMPPPNALALESYHRAQSNSTEPQIHLQTLNSMASEPDVRRNENKTLLEKPLTMSLTMNDLSQLIKMKQPNYSIPKDGEIFCNCGPSGCVGNCTCKNAGRPCNSKCHKNANYDHKICKNQFGCN